MSLAAVPEDEDEAWPFAMMVADIVKIKKVLNREKEEESIWLKIEVEDETFRLETKGDRAEVVEDGEADEEQVEGVAVLPPRKFIILSDVWIAFALLTINCLLLEEVQDRTARKKGRWRWRWRWMKEEVQSSCPDQPSRTQFGACRLTSKTLVGKSRRRKEIYYRREKEDERERKESSSSCE